MIVKAYVALNLIYLVDNKFSNDFPKSLKDNVKKVNEEHPLVIS